MDQTDTGLKAVMKALTDVVEPALDPNDPLAREQLRLAVEYIGFVRARIDFLHSRERFDLLHYIGLARAMVAAGVGPGSAPGQYLAEALAQALPLQDAAAARTDQLRAASMELAHAVAGVTQAAPDLPAEVAAKLRQIVLEESAPKLQFELHWYAPVGFDPDLPKDVALTDFFR